MSYVNAFVRAGILSLIVAQMSTGQLEASIQTGDIAILGLVGDSKNEWSWVPFVDISAGEVIYFSDTSYSSLAGGLGPRESLVRYTAPVGGLSAGTVLTIEEIARNSLSDADHSVLRAAPWGRTFDISRNGDPWLAFQTDDLSLGLSAPGFNPLFAVTSLTSNWDSYRGTRSITGASNLYPGLTDGVNAVAAGRRRRPGAEWDNVRYFGPTSGTHQELLSYAADAAYWQGTNRNPRFGYSNNRVSSFEVLPSSPPSMNPEPASLLVWSLLGVGVYGSSRRRRRRVLLSQ